MTPDQIIALLLEKRGLDTKNKVEDFLHPLPPDNIPLSEVGLKSSQIKKALDLISAHQKKDHPIAIYGDYDVDGICATAIIWEHLYANYQHVFPHIPDRRKEGYGLSIEGINHCIQKGAKLLITVDNGIVAHEQISYAKSQGLDVIIVDHHEPGQTPPPADVILHSQATCSAGLSWFITKDPKHLPLVAMAVVCDLIPLMGINRSLVKYGLQAISTTQITGLLALIQSAGLTPGQIDTYHLGFILGPRINAAGRLEHALDSLRLLCTRQPLTAAKLAHHLDDLNSRRQELTKNATHHALSEFNSSSLPSILISSSVEYDEGIVGLVAAKMVEKYFRPALAIARLDATAKGSARSIPGFDITAHLRKFSSMLTSVGGHAQAAGFSLNLANLDKFTKAASQAEISPDLLIRHKRIDVQIDLSDISQNLFEQISQLAPFGLGNTQPVFKSTRVTISSSRSMGANAQHLRLQVSSGSSTYSAVFFNYSSQPQPDPQVSYDITYRIDLNSYNGKTSLQLVISDIIPS